MDNMTEPEKDGLVKKIFGPEYLLKDNILRVIGFLADIIAIGGLIIQIRYLNLTKDIPVIFPAKIATGLAYTIWTLALYAYLCYLHKYWSTNRRVEGLAYRFAAFTIGDLFIRFKKPLLLFPILILAISFLAISFVSFGFPDGFAPIAILFAVPCIIILILKEEYKVDLRKVFINERKPFQSYIPTSISNSERAKVDKYWDELHPLITKKLTDSDLLTEYHFSELRILLGLDDDMLHYAFARYALEFKEVSYFGLIAERSTSNDNDVSPIYALINLKRIDSDKYEYM